MKTKSKPKLSQKEISHEIACLPPGAHALAALGPDVEKIVNRYFVDEKPTFFSAISQEFLKKLADALSKDWTHEEAAKVVDAYIEAFSSGRSVDESALCR